MPRTNEVIKEITKPTIMSADLLAAYYEIPELTELDVWALERLAGRRANAGDWTINISVTTLLSLLAHIRRAQSDV